MTALPDIPLPATIRSRYVDNINGLRMHVLEAGFETPGRPCILLLHGFPELAYSWRKVMPTLAAAGYHVIAPDQRGYGRTTGWSADYDSDLMPFRLTNLVRDALGLVSAFGYKHVDAVFGHDFGSYVAAWCALAVSGTFEKLKTRAINTEHSGTPSPNTPQILASLNKWNSNLVNVRQQSYDKANNTRFCEADFEYQNTPPTTVLMLLMFGEDPTCAKAVRYKVQPLQDQPDRFYVSWVCVG